MSQDKRANFLNAYKEYAEEAMEVNKSTKAKVLSSATGESRKHLVTMVAKMEGFIKRGDLDGMRKYTQELEKLKAKG